MAFDLAAVEIRHDEDGRRFHAVIDGHSAYLSYRRTAGRLVLDHTWVPAELERRGIGGKLVRTALDYARAKRLRVVPACPFAAAWIRVHPDYQELLSTNGVRGGG